MEIDGKRAQTAYLNQKIIELYGYHQTFDDYLIFLICQQESRSLCVPENDFQYITHRKDIYVIIHV